MFVDRPVGIDLGTTNSEVAILDPSERDLLVYADEFGRKTIPSAVAWDPKKEELLVGRAARNRRGRTPGPIESIKRKMGHPTTVMVGPKEMAPEEVSAAILGELKEAMLAHLKKGAPDEIDVRVGRAVITVPAYFDAPQMEATRKAGELAGLEVLGLLQEPTAAAIYHTWRHQLGDGNFLVYDLGGGTFDVSILRCLGGEYQVLAIDGDNYLGGDDFDRRYAEVLRKRLSEQGYDLDLDVRDDAEDATRFLRLVHLAQEIKESLSTREVVMVAKHDFATDRGGEPLSFEAEIGRAEYEEAIGDLVDTTIRCCERAIARSLEVAGVGAGDIDHVVLVGGSTRVPAVMKAVQEKLCAPAGIEAPLQDEVDTCVALGAAIHAAQLGGLRLGLEATENKPETRVLFTSPLVARKPELKLSLEVEAAPDGVSEVAVSDDEGPLVTAELSEIPSGRLRMVVPLGEEPEQRVRLELLGTQDAPLAEVPFALYRGDVRPRASSLSKPSVIAKDIALEVVRAGRRERKVLIPRGAGLPHSAEHRFYTADKSGAVVLRLLQNRLPIKTLVVTVPEGTEVGTPVDLALSCDETMRLEAKAVVAGQELWAQIEPAQLEAPKSAAAVEALLAEAEDVARGLWGREASFYRRELEPLATGLREVLSTDPDKAAALAARLQLLVEEFRDGSGEGLSPPMHRFEGILDALRRVVYRAGGTMLGMDQEAWEARIEDLQQRASAAWDAGDAAAWRRLYNETQALYETASEQEFASKRLDDPAYLQRRMMNVVAWSNHVERALRDFVPSTTEEVRALQSAERDRLLATLG
ncbi:MAG TPA: Hsp70 family protein, partial [Polyangiaceae bacterium LLY-WYZ-15_(1-7)]|nr:Hsp70 family protein [Polyangiaceae bacterium LLY-WYZ-15_(1-7)]